MGERGAGTAGRGGADGRGMGGGPDDRTERSIRIGETERAIARAARRLAWLKEHASGLTLDWGEDSAMWECSVISGGDRFTGVARDPAAAARECHERALKRMADNL